MGAVHVYLPTEIEELSKKLSKEKRLSEVVQRAIEEAFLIPDDPQLINKEIERLEADMHKNQSRLVYLKQRLNEINNKLKIKEEEEKAEHKYEKEIEEMKDWWNQNTEHVMPEYREGVKNKKWKSMKEFYLYKTRGEKEIENL